MASLPHANSPAPRLHPSREAGRIAPTDGGKWLRQRCFVRVNRTGSKSLGGGGVLIAMREPGPGLAGRLLGTSREPTAEVAVGLVEFDGGIARHPDHGHHARARAMNEPATGALLQDHGGACREPVNEDGAIPLLPAVAHHAERKPAVSATLVIAREEQPLDGLIAPEVRSYRWNQLIHPPGVVWAWRTSPRDPRKRPGVPLPA